MIMTTAQSKNIGAKLGTIIIIIIMIVIINLYWKKTDQLIQNRSISTVLNTSCKTFLWNRKRNSILKNMNATVLVFYGRQRFVQILNCYLEQNLIDNGGIISEVIFNAKTNNREDLEYLDTLLASHPGRYYKKNITNLQWTFESHYQSLQPERYYFKIDDDVVYIHPNAFELMLEAKILYSDVIFISANIINHPVLASVHGQMRAIHNLTALGNITGEDPNCHWQSARCGAIQHESFIQRLNENSLEFYMFPLWDFDWKDVYPRWSINLFLFQGKDVNSILPGDDEHQISIEIPKREKKHCIAIGGALAVHFAYGPQRNNGLNSNREAYLLEKYTNISKRVCHCVK